MSRQYWGGGIRAGSVTTNKNEVVVLSFPRIVKYDHIAAPVASSPDL
jgi:hypothetical protein